MQYADPVRKGGWSNLGNLEATPQTTHSHPTPSLSSLSQPLLLIPPLPIHHPYKPRQDRESYEAKKKR